MNSFINGLAVFTAGEQSNRPIIFIHGFPCDNTMWEHQVNFFKEEYFCVSYDVGGLGKSKPGDGQFTIEQFVDDLKSIILELDLNEPVLCGLSMGGYISLRAMERMQEKFSALILCDTKSWADTNEAKIKRADAISRINNGEFIPFINEFVANCFSESFKSENTEEYNKILSRSLANNPTGVKGCLLAMAARTDTTEFLQKINIPTLLICGGEDKLTPPPVMKAMAEKINGAGFIIVDGAGHMAPIEKPDKVNFAIKSFLNKNLLRD